MAKSIATGAPACTGGAPAIGMGPRATCCAPTATIRTSRTSARWHPSRPHARQAAIFRVRIEEPSMASEQPVPRNANACAHPSRRLFTISAAATAASWILTACGPKRLFEAPKDRLKSLISDLELRYRNEYGKDVHVSDAPAMPGVQFAYALDISRCIGCRRCVYACVEENNQSRDPQVHWIRVLSMEKGKGVDFSHADPYYHPAQVPEEGHFYIPVSCQQCQDPPCVKVCPT